MNAEPDLARIASTVGDARRIQMLALLMEGRALTAKELALGAGIEPATATAHLKRLRRRRARRLDRAGAAQVFPLRVRAGGAAGRIAHAPGAAATGGEPEARRADPRGALLLRPSRGQSRHRPARGDAAQGLARRRRRRRPATGPDHEGRESHCPARRGRRRRRASAAGSSPAGASTGRSGATTSAARSARRWPSSSARRIGSSGRSTAASCA